MTGSAVATQNLSKIQAKLAKLRALCTELNGQYTPAFRLSAPVANKLGWMIFGGHHRPARNFLVVTPSLEKFVQEAVAKELKTIFDFPGDRIPTANNITNKAAAALKEAVIERFVMGGGYGFVPAPLSAKYAQWKFKWRIVLLHGIGFQTGVMFRALKSAKWDLQKVG